MIYLYLVETFDNDDDAREFTCAKVESLIANEADPTESGCDGKYFIYT